MGTRSITRVIEDGKHIMNMYRQFDGYPSGHGKELAEFIHGKPMVNGFQGKNQLAFNGGGCLAAGIVSNFKKGIGGFYLKPVEQTDCWQDYEYILIVDSIALTLRINVISHGEALFEGDTQQFIEWCDKPEDDEE